MKVTAHRSTTGYQIDLGNGAYMDFYKTAGTDSMVQPRVGGFMRGVGLDAGQLQELAVAIMMVAIKMIHGDNPGRPPMSGVPRTELRPATWDERAEEYGGC